MNRAYSLLEIKDMNDDARTITGVATTISPDRMGDVVDPMGAEFKLPIPLLWQHDSHQPIGHVTDAKVTKTGITVTAQIAKGVSEQIDQAWSLIKSGLVRGLSIGFRGLDTEQIPNSWGVVFKTWEWLELSAVTIPANAEASIQTIKSIDQPLLAATGKEPKASDRPVSPGVTGKSTTTKPVKAKEAKSMKTIAEQITAFEATRAAKSARMTELMNVAAEKGLTLDTAETEEYDGLEVDVKSIDAHLVRLHSLEDANKKSAAAVDGSNAQRGSDSRAGVAVLSVKTNVPKGTAFTRYAMALMASKGNLMQAAEIAKRWDDQTPEVGTVLKAAVAAGTTTDTNWAKPLVEYQNMASEFAELLRPQTIIGRIPGLRRVPFNIKVPRTTSGSSASWVGEGAPKPVSAMAFDQITLGTTKLAGIVVLTEELVRASNPAAEQIVRDDLSATIVQTMDRDFVDPSKAASAGVSPASITNGVTPVTASGTDSDHVRADVQALMGKFVAANMSLAGAVWIMSETMALALAMMLNPLGQREFPGIEINGSSGGTFFNLPVVLSENVPANPGSGSPVVGSGARLILAKASEILLADDGEVVLDASNQASLQMDSAPTNPPTASTVMVSLWQMNMVGIRAERFINWTKRRAGAVQYIDAAKYGA